MEESPRSNPVFVVIVLCLLIGAAIFFVSGYEVVGLDGIRFRTKSTGQDVSEGLADPTFVGTSIEFAAPTFGQKTSFGSSFSALSQLASSVSQKESDSTNQANEVPVRRIRNLRIASWALDGFGPSKFAQPAVRQNLIRVIRKFDIVCFQQINSVERDIVPRIVDAINEGGQSFEYVIGQPTGTQSQSEQLAIVFDTRRVRVDRSQIYTVADPQGQITFDPLVAWFRAAEPLEANAWTFSIVNVRINLARAPQEVALLPGILSSVRSDGRGEDDVVMVGLFQADDAYLLKKTMPENMVAAVRNAPTDIFGRHQTCNVLVDRSVTNEYFGRGGPLDFLRLFNLSFSEAEQISSHLPVFAEFTATEAGLL